MDLASATGNEPSRHSAPCRAALPEPRSGLFLCAAAVLSLPYVLLSAVTGFAWFDDEGTLLAFVRSVLDGHTLYDETYSLYGPFYHLVYGFIYGALGVPVDTIAGRLLTAGFWLGITAVLAAFAIRLSGSLIVGAFSYLMILTSGAVMLTSAGHPEEVSLLMLGALLLLVASAERRMRAVTLAAIGALLAALALTKINLGAYVGGAVLVVLLHVTQRPGWLRIALKLAACALPALPVVLLSLLFAFPWVRSYALYATLVILPAVAVWMASDPPRIMARPMWLPLLAGAAAAAAAIVAAVIAQGSTFHAVVKVVLLQNVDFVRNWYIPLDVGWPGLAMAGLSASAGLGCARVMSRRTAAPRARALVTLLKFAVALLGCPLLVAPHSRFVLVMPFAWLVIVPPRGAARPRPVTRGTAGLIGAMMVLYPFPVAGHQVDLVILLPWLLPPLLFWDAAIEARALGWLPSLASLSGRRLAVGAALACLIVLAARTGRSARVYAAAAPLDLPGAALIRVSPSQAQTFQWLAHELAACPAMISLPGMYSLNIWTGHALLTPINENNLLDTVSPADQNRIVQAISPLPHLCVVYQPAYLARFDRGQIATDPPLLRYILENFAPTAERDGFQIMKRKGT